jgi:hypothetical protein
MWRFLIGLALVLSIFCLIWNVLGQEAFFWALFIGGFGAALGLLFIPKRGPQHAYRNWVRLQALIISIGVVVFVVGSILGLAVLTPRDMSDQAQYAVLTAMGTCVGGLAYGYGWWMGPPTARRGWLRRRYPAVANVIKRYEKPGDGRELYTPLLIIDGNPYFLIAYPDRRNPSHAIGYLLLDEHAHRVQDEEMFKLAVKCNMLALQTIDHGFHERRANEIASFENAAVTLRRMFQILRQQRERFASKGAQALADWEQVAVRMRLWQAQWAKDHGMRRLTQVSDKDVEEVEKAMDGMAAPLRDGLGLMARAVEATKRLVKVIEGETRFPQKRMVMEGLLGIADGKPAFERRGEPFQYTTVDEDALQAWRDRMAWADQVDARLAQKAGQEAVR